MDVNAQPSADGQCVRLTGRVQGVGMRPTLWRLARQLGLTGRVHNDGQGVVLELWGDALRVQQLIENLDADLPPLARIDSLQCSLLYGDGPDDFCIAPSAAAEPLAQALPDAATCPQCLAEIRDPQQRRYRYPFTSCTHCGPRLSIQRALPWDRDNTSMAGFTLCPDCQSEYDNPADRRFHAQPLACPQCGPQCWLVDGSGQPMPLADGDIDAIAQAARLLDAGAIVAIKGLGGFHLACDAANDDAVRRLRAAKQRDAKPFATMMRDLSVVDRYCDAGADMSKLLASPQAPIVLLSRRENAPPLADCIAAGLGRLGVMLPSTPLHHLLMEGFDRPLVMTSGNLSGEPPCIDNDAAIERLGPICDALLLHDRDIVNRVDDSLFQETGIQPQCLRLARGYAPEHLPLPPGLVLPGQILAMGAELKNSFCLLRASGADLSQHIGDLGSLASLDDYRQAQARYRELFGFSPSAVAVDRHPNYQATRLGEQLAAESGIPLVQVQHHHAHIAACMAEHGLSAEHPKVLGVALDGLGYGDEGELWGGEILLADYRSYRRLARLQPMPLIGGEQAMREPWRNLYAHLAVSIGWQKCLERYPGISVLQCLQDKPLATAQKMMDASFNAPLSSAAGRWFDAVAAALGICFDSQDYEGQAAMQLQALAESADRANAGVAYPLPLEQSGELLQLQCAGLWQALLADLHVGVASATVAYRFHAALAGGLHRALIQLMDDSGARTVVLSGGVFQNALLLELLQALLQRDAVTVLSPQRVPANDGGLALGQAVVAAARLNAGGRI